MNDNKEFRPYIPADKIMPEITVKSVVMGIILALIFGTANAYLGLSVGMTVSASIPAAVMAMGFIKVVFKKNSILESNVIQTIGSAGESVAAGAIFTLPALFLWAKEGRMDKPNMIEIMLIAIIGGLLGVLFMVPLRNALIVKEHGVLPYPEGTACSEVLMAGEEGGANASTVFMGMGIGAFFKFIIDGLKVVPSQVSLTVKGFAGEIGTQIYPAVMSVGYICGPRISSYMFAGGVLAWLVLIPVIVLFGAETVLYPGTETIGAIFSAEGASGIWDNYIRYIGAGALAAGGILSLVKSLPLIIKTFRDAIKGMKNGGSADTSRTAKDLSMKLILISILVLTIAIWLIPAIPVTLVGAIIIVIFGFFFATVSSRMVGLVGSSNNPVSGMAIATLLVSTLVLKLTGDAGMHGMQGAIAIGSIICIVAAISGDTSQDLKTGYLLGATPVKQQIGEFIGVISSGLAMGVVLYLLDAGLGMGSKALAAPQATLMKMIVEGVMENNLPWGLIIIGIFVAVVVELIGIPVLPFAIGVYLPVHLNACIMVGGLVRLAFDKMKKDKEEKDAIVNDGILCCSGMIAGEGLVGVLIAVFAIAGIDKKIDLSGKLGLSPVVSNIGSIVVFALVILCLLKLTIWKKRKADSQAN